MFVVHTADVHIGVENYGRPDPKTKVSTRLTDFLNSLDELVDYALDNDADMVLFCGDAYKSRNPSQTHQREFAKRISRLSNSNIAVFLVSGNHDSPNIHGPATALDIFPVLNVENVYIGDTIGTHNIMTKSGPIQIIALPWIRKGEYMSLSGSKSLSPDDLNIDIENSIKEKLDTETKKLGPAIPSTLAGHVSVTSAITRSEKSMMLGKDYTLDIKSLARKELDYIALGHIHRHQVLNEDPKVVYPGSLERIDFGEEKDIKGFCVIEFDPNLEMGQKQSKYQFVPVNARNFITIKCKILPTDHNPTSIVEKEIAKYNIADSIVQVHIDVPASKASEIKEQTIRSSLESAHHVANIRKNIERETRLRLGQDIDGNIEPMEALKAYLLERSLGKDISEKVIEKAKGFIEENPI